MDRLSRDQLKLIAHLIADRNLSAAERELRAQSIAGSVDLARRALDWLPEAFGLVALSRINGLDLPTTFSAKCIDGSWREFPLSAEPIYVQAADLAHDPTVPFRAVAEQSSCVNAVDNALNSGASLHGSKISGPALVGISAETYLSRDEHHEVGA